MTVPSAVVVGVGAENGVGAALCRRFARGGYHVFIAGRMLAKIEAVAAKIARAGGRAEAVRTDVTSQADVAALFDRAMAGLRAIAQSMARDFGPRASTSPTW